MVELPVYFLLSAESSPFALLESGPGGAVHFDDKPAHGICWTQYIDLGHNYEFDWSQQWTSRRIVHVSARHWDANGKGLIAPDVGFAPLTIASE